MHYKAEVEGATLNKVGRANQDNLVVDRLIQGIGGASQFSFQTVIELDCPRVFAVLDGVGGEADGSAASECGAQALAEVAAETLTEEGVRAALDRANLSVADHFQNGPIGASTLSAVFLHRDEAIVAYVGDSPVYLLRDNVLRQLSVPQTEAAELGLAAENKTTRAENTLTRYLGNREKSGSEQAELLKLSLCHGDAFLICSDGVEKGLSVKEIEKRLRKGKSHSVEALVRDAYKKADKEFRLDDTTALLIRIL